MISAILILLLLPIINTSNIRSTKFRPLFGIFFWFFFINFLILGWIGQKPVEDPYIEIGMFSTLFYFVSILFILPILGFIENFLLKKKIY